MSGPADGLFDAGPDVLLVEAQAWLRDRLEEGARCPCCEQHAQLYRWSLYGSAARLLTRFWIAGGVEEFVESKAVKQGTQGSASHLRFWGLVEQEAERRPDGGKSGWWRVTPLGQDFIRERTAIKKYAYVYNGEVLRLDGPPVALRDVLGGPFDWREHMRPEGALF